MGFVVQLLKELSFTTLLAVTVTCLVLHYIYSKKKYKSLKSAPSVPFLGSIPFMEKYAERTFAKWAKRYGPVYRVKLGSYDTVVLNSYEAIEQAFVKQSSQFLGRYTNLLTDLSSCGGKGIIFLNDIEKWKVQRRFGLRAMSGAALQGRSLEERVLDEAQLLCLQIKCKQGQPFVLESYLAESFSNVINKITLNERSSEEGNEDLMTFVKEVTRSTHEENMMYFLLILAPWLRFIPPAWGRYKRMLKFVEFTLNILYKYIDQHEANLDPEHPSDFTGYFLMEKKRGNFAFDKKQLGIYLKDLIFAGTETSASTIRWILFHLILQPQIQTKIHEEIDKVIGKEGDVRLGCDLPYVKAVIQEGFRTETVAPLGVPRRTCEDVNLMGQFIPRDTQVIANIWSVHNDPDVWPNPWRFDPERHLNENGEFVKSNRIIPFSIGPRNCLGENLARIEVFLFLVCILQTFHVLPNPSNPTPDMVGPPGPVYSPPQYKLIMKER